MASQPSFDSSTMLLLTDGTVMCQEFKSHNWYRLTPNTACSYIQGTWTALSSMRDARLYYASAVLAEGRVIVAGGEYNGGASAVELNTVELYDPSTNTWSVVDSTLGWDSIGDAPCCVMPDKTFLMGSIDGPETALFDPGSNTWSTGGAKLGSGNSSSEETWTLLRDGSVLTVDCGKHPNAEKYVAGAWVSAGRTPNVLVEPSSLEIGPAILMADGKVLTIGATGHTAIYLTGAVPRRPGLWREGPDFPRDGSGYPCGAKDAPACLLPDGRIVCAAAPISGDRDDYKSPTSFCEFDGDNLVSVASPPNADAAPYRRNMLLLPTGEVLFSGVQNDEAGNPVSKIYAYVPDGIPVPERKPLITSFPRAVTQGTQLTLDGTGLNGLSQAVSYGDDASAATNYPIVRIVNKESGTVRYCRTGNHSTMAVATGGKTHSTDVSVPGDIEPGPSQLYLVANGIASEPYDIVINPA